MSTLAQLVTRVREKVDEETAAFWTDPVIENQLNEAYRFYQAFIIKLHEGFFAKIANIDFDGNPTGEYALPADYIKTRILSRLLSNEKVPLRFYDRFDTSISTSVSNSTYNLPTYRFRGNNLVFEPAPDFSETKAIEHEYIRNLAVLTSGQDVDDEFPALGEDCVIARAVVKCKGIEEMVAGGGDTSDPFVLDTLSSEQMLKELLEQRSVARQYVEQFGIYGDDIQSWTL